MSFKTILQKCAKNFLLKIRINKQYFTFKKHSDNKNAFKKPPLQKYILTKTHSNTICTRLYRNYVESSRIIQHYQELRRII